jgi:FixJ family two-component response regulator
LLKKTVTRDRGIDATTRVDIVDDDPSVRRALGRLLNSVGLAFRAFDSAAAYLESQDREAVACLLLDLHLPEMSGIELLEHLSEVAPDLSVICMTGRDEPDVEDRVKAVGALACLRKPFDEGELFKAMSRSSEISIP